jgi:hypothetical protein
MKNKTFLLVGIFCLVLIFSMLSVSKIQAVYQCVVDGCVCIEYEEYSYDGCPNGKKLDESKDCGDRYVCCCPITCTGDCKCIKVPGSCDSGYSQSTKTCGGDDEICCCPEGVNGNENGNENGNGNFIRIENPLTATSFEMIINNSIDFIFQIALVLAPLMVVIAGFLFVTAGGNSEQINKAKTMIIWTAIGFLIILLSKGIMGIIMNLLGVG